MKGGARKIEDARIINDRCRKKYPESFIYPEMIVPGYNFNSSLYRFDITGKENFVTIRAGFESTAVYPPTNC